MFLAVGCRANFEISGILLNVQSRPCCLGAHAYKPCQLPKWWKGSCQEPESIFSELFQPEAHQLQLVAQPPILVPPSLLLPQ